MCFLVHNTVHLLREFLDDFLKFLAIFAMPSLFVTPRVSYVLNGTFSCTLLYMFLVHSTSFTLFAFSVLFSSGPPMWVPTYVTLAFIHVFSVVPSYDGHALAVQRDCNRL